MGYGQGKEITRSKWPKEKGPYLRLLEFLDEVHKSNGCKSNREVARRARLSPNQVNRILRGLVVPSGENRLKELVGGLGGGESEKNRAVLLLSRCTGARPSVVLKGASSGWWRSPGYLDRVRDLVPADGLREREEELSELAAFCRGDEGYVSWQAGPWAGKSALMATFVLDPPPGVDVVSFFVTARLSAYADSTAFCAALAEQLAAFIGPRGVGAARSQTAGFGEPPGLPGSLQAALHRYGDLLTAATNQAIRAGRRLVLVVDGLDEDRGSVPGTGLPSIASLLPRAAGEALGVIVSGRSDPPIPDDVADNHPLRASRIRPLAVSPHASRIRRLARRELDELLTRDKTHRDLIGLVAASGGGLSVPDVQELTGRAAYEVDQLILGVCGRTIAVRSDYAKDAALQILMFTHDTLRAEAASRLGPGALASYRHQIHTWADTYKDNRWPAGTPAYLLRDYGPMLAAHPGDDLGRLVALATDPARHDRALDLTGGDAAALEEISAAQRRILASTQTDLLALLRLAIHQDELAHRNSGIPASLPAVWAALGVPGRAESLVRGIADPVERTSALVKLTWRLLVDGDHDTAARLADNAEETARTIQNPARQAYRFLSVSRVLAALGSLDRAHDLLVTVWSGIGNLRDTLTESVDRVNLRLALPIEAAVQGDHVWAETLAREIAATFDMVDQPAPGVQRGRASLAEALAPAGEPGWAVEWPRNFRNAFYKFAVLETVASVVLHSGDRQQFQAVTDLIAFYRSQLNSPDDQYHANSVLAEVAGAAGDAGWYAKAGQLIRQIDHPEWRIRALADLAEILIAKGRYAPATALLNEAGELHRTLQDGETTLADARSALAAAIAGTGDYHRAEQIAAQAHWPYQRIEALVATALAAADRGDRDDARAIAVRAEQHIRSRDDRTRVIAALTRLLTSADQAGNQRLAGELAGAAESLAVALTDEDGDDIDCSTAKENLGLALAATGHPDRAERVASGIMWPARQDAVLRAAAAAREADRTRSLTQNPAATIQADRTAWLLRSIRHPGPGLRTMAKMLAALDRLTDPDRTAVISRAKRYARKIQDPHDRAKALIVLARALDAAGRHEQAAAVAGEAESQLHFRYVEGELRTPSLTVEHAAALSILITSVAATGDTTRAAELAAYAETIAADHCSVPIPIFALDPMIGPDYFTGLEVLDKTLTILVHAVGSASQVESAVAIADRIPTPHIRAAALEGVLESAAAYGRYDTAESLLHRAVDADRRIPAYIVLATAAVTRGDRDRARRYLAAALTTDGSTAYGGHNWTDVLNLLARVDSGALEVIAREYAARLPVRYTSA